jgi:hypothetical protein
VGTAKRTASCEIVQEMPGYYVNENCQSSSGRRHARARSMVLTWVRRPGLEALENLKDFVGHTIRLPFAHADAYDLVQPRIFR